MRLENESYLLEPGFLDTFRKALKVAREIQAVYELTFFYYPPVHLSDDDLTERRNDLERYTGSMWWDSKEQWEGFLAEVTDEQKRRRTFQEKKSAAKQRRSQFQRDRPRLKILLIERDGYACKECGSQEGLEIDHVVPLSRGGSDDLGNLQWLCDHHNSKKRDKVLV